MKKNKIVIVSDSFKGSLSSFEAGSAIANGVKKRLPYAETVVFPTGDGGEGTAYAISSAIGYKKCCFTVNDTNSTLVAAEYYVSADGKCAVFDMASCSGLSYAVTHGLDIMHASTEGVGQMISHLISDGVSDITVCLGGSGTSDGGVGALSALGARFFDKNGAIISERACPTMFGKIASADLSPARLLLKNVKLTLLYDSAVPLLGERGAVMMYSRQKGAADADLVTLEENMEHYSHAIASHSDITKQGAGAAGGLGFALSLVGGKLTLGAAYVLETIGFNNALSEAVLVITGEGKTDVQTATGKLTSIVAHEAAKLSIPVICLCGVNESCDELYKCGFTSVIQIGNRPMSAEESINDTARLLEKAAYDIAGIAEFLK